MANFLEVLSVLGQKKKKKIPQATLDVSPQILEHFWSEKQHLVTVIS